MRPNQPVATIRADCGTHMGHGHVMRTLALAEQLSRREGFSVRYVISADSEESLIVEHRRQILRLPPSDSKVADLAQHVAACDGPLIIDTYDTTEEDLIHLAKAGYCIAVIDDGCRLPTYPVDLVIDSAPSATSLSYQGSIHTRFLLGAPYFLLRAEFRALPIPAVKREKSISILVTFGGVDELDMTSRVLTALNAVGNIWEVVAILGASYRGKADKIALGENIKIVRKPSQVADYFASADIAICSAGGTALELAYLGIPMILIVLADNQNPIARVLMEEGAAIFLGEERAIDESKLIAVVEGLVASPLRRTAMSESARRLIDGSGSIRVAEAISDVWHRHTPCRETGVHG